ncbi:MAG: ATP-binding protein [Chrysiogenales bacterium]|nr:MAG: ATP-binding protein [Chrysiogenales bacterium]
MQDLSLHILDIVENSTMAGATLVEVRLTEDREKDLLTLVVKDNGAGMDGRMLEKVRDPFATTRTTRRVGMGIPLLEQAVRDTGGNLAIESEPGKGTTISASFVMSHIDRKPLGNLGSTIITLIMGNPGVDFAVHVDTGETEAELDTRDVKSALEGVAITHPEVLESIRKLFDG